jgi:hypothetical protein
MNSREVPRAFMLNDRRYAVRVTLPASRVDPVEALRYQ